MHPVKEQQTVLEAFRSLPLIEPCELVGLWKGHGIPAGHPFDGVLEKLGWFGKRFTPDMRADALLFLSGQRRLVAIDPKWIPPRLALRFHWVGRTRVARNLFSYLLRPRGGRGDRQKACGYGYDPLLCSSRLSPGLKPHFLMNGVVLWFFGYFRHRRFR
ncbi:GXWXG domain-containing protein [Rhizobium sullae]|uniref:GXWXG domain-containing protein n=1 Tax=Rhizobium sullae TaxID=50338 RepID=UPI000B3549F7|nr:GXWXG domain-containing protein [Rhizobium sullae]